MQTLRYDIAAPRAAGGTRPIALVGVVASGNLEVLLERGGPANRCTIEIATTAQGFDDLWAAVTADVVAARGGGGLRIAINDGGARPDTVALRLAQGIRLIEEPDA